MDLGLRGKIALLSAASRGIGLACAKALAREGAHVAFFARNPDQVASAVAEIEEVGGEAPLGKAIDLAEDAAVAAFVRQAEDRFGGLDIVVANSIGPRPGTFQQFSPADWLRAFDGAVVSAIKLIQAAMPGLLKSRSAAVVGIQSTSVRQPIPGLALSNGVRPAAAGLFKSLAVEYGPQGIRFNIVCPGRIKTERFLSVESSYGEPLGERIAKKAAEVPLRRLGEPEEVADAVAFLASSRAAYITGSVLAVDGGNTRGIF